jgi:meiotically up-regulated gene 157 (Mug157) protein
MHEKILHGFRLAKSRAIFLKLYIVQFNKTRAEPGNEADKINKAADIYQCKFSFSDDVFVHF